MEKMLETITAQELYKQGQIEKEELESKFNGKTIIKFHSYKEAREFGIQFVNDYLIPKYGIEEAKRFPMAKSGPAIDDFTKQLLDPEERPTWIVVPTERFDEVEEYLQQYMNKKE